MFNEQEKCFKGGEFNEQEVRFTYSAIYALKILGEPIPPEIDRYFLKCHNYDGGFGGKPGAESHAAYCFCAVAGLAIVESLDKIKQSKLVKFLSLRQTS